MTLLGACSAPKAKPTEILGETMGTYYRVLAYCEPKGLQTLLTDRLRALNATFSNYDPSSELMEFNRASPNAWHPLSAELLQVLAAAQQVHIDSQGALDISVAPLVSAWGFGPKASKTLPPAATKLNELMQHVGQHHLELDLEQGRALKRRGLELDLSAIAKGFAVDALSDLLTSQGCQDHLVDIGGEVRAMGSKADGQLWRVGIEVPNNQQMGAIARALPLADQGVATSGDYRNFIQQAGGRWSHTIDPRTGAPVTHRVASVTVVMPTTQLADAWATAFTVMGADLALSFAETRGWPVLTIERRQAQVAKPAAQQGFDATFEVRYTAAMASLLAPAGPAP